jgi:hypothetical protein
MLFMRAQLFAPYFYALLVSLALYATSSCQADQSITPGASSKVRKVVFQVTDEDTKKWNLTLVNALNVIAALGKHNVAMEIVVYGPAIDMLRIESEVAPRVDEVIANGVKVVACENTMRGAHIVPADMLPNISFTRTGVAYLMEKQEEGYSYIRP